MGVYSLDRGVWCRAASMKTVSILLALAGVAAAMVLVAWFDVGAVWAATISVGWGGFGVLLLLQAGLFVLLGLAWAAVMPGVPKPLLVWGRMVRDAATTCLPFSPIGGYVIGARAITLQGVAWPQAAAGTVIDATAEILAQLLFALFGAAALLVLLPVEAGISVAGPVALGGAVALLLLGVGLWQRRRIGQVLRALGGRLLGEWFTAQHGAGGGLERLQAELTRAYAPRRMAIAAGLHLSGWFATGVVTWFALRMLGSHAELLPVVALEALLDALIAAAFIVPGAAGVQEAGYVGIGALFGIPPDLALSVSLLRRGKDLVWGIPILGFWQWREVRRLAAR